MTEMPILVPTRRPQSDQIPFPLVTGPTEVPAMPTEPVISTAAVTYSCGGCANRWSGVSRAHCSACHRTFGGAAFFDRHRRERNGEGYCLDPALIEKPEMFLTGGLWMSVENPTARKAPIRRSS